MYNAVMNNYNNEMQTMFCTACELEMPSLTCNFCMRVYVGSDGENTIEKELEREISNIEKSMTNKISTHSCTHKAKKISDCRELVRSTLDDIEFSGKPSCPEMSSSYWCRFSNKDYFYHYYTRVRKQNLRLRTRGHELYIRTTYTHTVIKRVPINYW